MKNVFYAQSGGVTAVLNATACGLIETARRMYKDKIGSIYAGRNGIIGALLEDLIDIGQESNESIASLRYTPGAAFGSCRYKLGDPQQYTEQYHRLLEVFAAHNIHYFFYNGGGDSQDTAYKVFLFSQKQGYDLTCIGLPKTIDNDLPFTDNSPGFGSAAKYIATSIYEASLEIASMWASSTQIFILEVMGRHSGWLAAASGLAAGNNMSKPPHLILFPEIAFEETLFLEKVNHFIQKEGFCVIVAAEGLRYADGRFLTEQNTLDAFGHKQLGGVAPRLATLIKEKYGYKYHWAISDYLQRSARHLASKVDVEQAYAIGKAALQYAIEGKNAIMPIITRLSYQPYRWGISEAPLASVANQEKHLPKAFIREDGFHITDACRKYLLPLITGEDYPPYKGGLPDYIMLKKATLPKKLATYSLNKP